ncbi:sugar phosphate isomerase/epimerase family protein [Sediminicola luteus]|uniref:Xylose isomerase n=1 Tax=Sediminicola luteus TaxID=319238 RepID=A0A2A4GEX0_9FLAO|nr:sugar phosphate isomerase/epimerase family protein [Sediminicola luteus]PCE66335.1 xylose isomerase [Sediminicola luteus]
MKNYRLASKGLMLGLGVLLISFQSCKEKKKEVVAEAEVVAEEVAQEPFFKLSLAQWSMHNMIWKDGVDPYQFAEKAKGWGFSGLEYVSGLYYNELKKDNFSEAAMAKFVERSNAEAKKYGMENLLIMIDGQGDLATPDAAKRKEAVENHYKWVDAAAAMGCHTIRVNLAGSNEKEAWTAAAVDGLTQLATYAKDKNINVTVENHGGLSSNGAYLAEVMAKVNMDNCGTLPDFGNFCIKREKGGCAESYDIYQGVTELMPYAKAVSAKSHNFDAEGNETEKDYVKLLQIVKDAGYTGYIGVEYEGSELSEEDGIIATRDLLVKAAKEVK